MNKEAAIYAMKITGISPEKLEVYEDLKTAFTVGYDLGITETPKTPQSSEFVTINGLEWCRENLDGGRLMTLDEAHDVAHGRGLRVPTIGELNDLVDNGGTWDVDRKGKWFGVNHERKMDSRGSIFLPAAGFCGPNNGMINNQGGYYWSSDRDGDNHGFYLYFGSGTYPYTAHKQLYAFAVRCVRQ